VYKHFSQTFEELVPWNFLSLVPSLASELCMSSCRIRQLLGYLPFTRTKRKFRLEKQMVCVIPIRKFRKTRSNGTRVYEKNEKSGKSGLPQSLDRVFRNRLSDRNDTYDLFFQPEFPVFPSKWSRGEELMAKMKEVVNPSSPLLYHKMTVEGLELYGVMIIYDDITLTRFI